MTSTEPDHTNRYQPLGVVSISLTLLIVTLWGATAVANQYAMDVLPPLFVGGLRFLLAAFFMVGWCFVTRDQLILTGQQWRIAFILGVLLFLQIGTFNIGIDESSSSHATILVNSFIFWVAAYECVISRTIRLRWWQALGLILAAGGCCSLLLAASESTTVAEVRDPPTLRGDLFLALSGFILGMKILYTKHAVQFVKPGPLILWHDIFGMALLFGWSALSEIDWSNVTQTLNWSKVTMTTIWAMFIGGVIISGFCFAVNAWLLKKHGASQVSVFSFSTPITGVVLGVVMRGDRLSIWIVIAGALVAAGIFLVNYVSRNPADSVEESHAENRSEESEKPLLEGSGTCKS